MQNMQTFCIAKQYAIKYVGQYAKYYEEYEKSIKHDAGHVGKYVKHV